MEERDKIYDLFRRNEHKLAEKPSRRAWDRLEDRLDRHQQQTTRQISGWYRYGGMVAAVMVLVLTASILSIYTQQSDKAQFASADMEMTAGPLLDLPEIGSKSSFLKVVHYQKEYQNHARRIVEGDGSSVLEPRKNNYTKKVAGNRGGIAMNDIKQEEVQQKTKSEYVKTVYDNEDVQTLNDNYAIMDHQDVQMNATQVVIADANLDHGSDISPEMPFEDVEMSKEKEKVDADMSIAGYTTTSSSVSAPPAPSAPTNTGNAPGFLAMEEKTSKTSSAKKKDAKETVRSSVDYELDDVAVEESASMFESEEEIQETPLAQFDWLIGEWVENTSNGQSVEKWERVDDNTFKGNGSLVANGVTIFSEKMEIRKTKSGIYMMINLNNSKKKTKYKLVSEDGRKLLFENKKVDFPNQLILYKNSNDSFTTIMQNDVEQELVPAGDYLQNRNIIVNQQVTRNMKRSK